LNKASYVATWPVDQTAEQFGIVFLRFGTELSGYNIIQLEERAQAIKGTSTEFKII
jgi:hypothetical protein